MKRFLLEKAHRNWQTYLSEAGEEVAKAAEASADASTALSDLHKQAQDAQKEKASALSDLAAASKAERLKTNCEDFTSSLRSISERHLSSRQCLQGTKVSSEGWRGKGKRDERRFCRAGTKSQGRRSSCESF
jgi:chromosome segregation ATPase